MKLRYFTFFLSILKGPESEPLNEGIPSNLHICIKNNKREIKKSTETLKLILTNHPNYSSHFLEYATKLYNEEPRTLREVNNYCEIISKLEKVFI